ncbi:aspartic peptidase domain-containing protein [Amylocystis lapponica]|nr:aspartic peptidase domain-containing protein [Amylocystis lapponica]
MLAKVSLLTVALALFASAIPATHNSDLRIPLQRRGSLTRADGTFDHQAAIRDRVKLHNKHRQNMLNLQRNSGAVMHIPPLATMPESAQKKRQVLPLTDQDANIEWTGVVSVGTPAQNFTIDFDTGSADFWVPSASCSKCLGQARYNASASSTSKEKSNGTFQINYESGSATGDIYTDIVSMAGVSVPGQTFGNVNESSGYPPAPADGVMGMAFQSISATNSKPWFFSAVSQGAVKQGVFSMKLASSGAELYVGGTDPSLYSGDIEYHPQVNSSVAGYWQIGGANATVNGQTVASDIYTIIDSGTTLMYASADAVAQFYAKIEGAQEYDSENGLYSIPCNSTSTITFSWGGKLWPIRMDVFNTGPVSRGSDQCMGALGVDDLGSNIWLLGCTFMANVYTAFDTTNNAVGFAKLS